MADSTKTNAVNRLGKMTPVEQAASVYQSEPCVRSFKEDLEAHLIHGYVFSTPAAFVMGRPVQHDAPVELIINPWHVFPTEQCDCWLVYLAAGDISEIRKFQPYPQKYIAWERKNSLKVHLSDHVHRLCNFSTLFFAGSLRG